jgi:hypothetical protein
MGWFIQAFFAFPVLRPDVRGTPITDGSKGWDDWNKVNG